MLVGEVIWYKRDYGYGFIRHTNEEQVFFHHSTVERAGEGKLKLKAGTQVEYECKETNLGLKATKVKRL